MNTRKAARLLGFQAAILLLVTVILLVSMNAVTGMRLERQKQDALCLKFQDVILGTRFERLRLDDKAREQFPEILTAYRVYSDSNAFIGYVAEYRNETDGEEFISHISLSADATKLTGLTASDAPISSDDAPAFFAQFQQMRMPAALAHDMPGNAVTTTVYPPVSGLKDGNFRESLDTADSSGYKDYVAIVVAGGRITAVTWDAVAIDGGKNRAEASVSGEFKLDGDQEIWAAQAYAMQNMLLEVQDPAKIAIKSDGTTEVVPGVTVNVNAFFKLANLCIDDSKNGDFAEPESSTSPTPTRADISPTLTPAMISVTPVPDLGDEGTDDSDPGSEDGVILNANDAVTADSIDGFGYSEIKTQLQPAGDSLDVSRSVIRGANRMYLFLTRYLKGEF